MKAASAKAMADTGPTSTDTFFEELANAIDAFVKSGTVTVPDAPIPVSVDPTTGVGATTGTGTGLIS